MAIPQSTEYDSFYSGYVNLCTQSDAVSNLEESLINWNSSISKLDPNLANYAYDSGKWTVNQLLAHCIDTERIFQYRSLRIAREDQAILSGFAEDLFAENYQAKDRTIESLNAEFLVVRNSTIYLFNSFSPQHLEKLGLANGKPISVNALGFIMAGHGTHHLNILKERYL